MPSHGNYKAPERRPLVPELRDAGDDALWSFGLGGSIALVISGLVALILPSPTAIREGGFFVILRGTSADAVEIVHPLAIPALIAGGVCLLASLVLMRWRSTVMSGIAGVVQTIAGAIGGIASVLCIAVLAVNLLIWTVVTLLAILIVIVILVGLGTALTSG